MTLVTLMTPKFLLFRLLLMEFLTMAIEIQEFKELNRNTLRGFLSVRMTTVGIEIKGIAYHEKPDGKRWIQLPTKPYEKADGGTAYVPIVEFFDVGKARLFQKLTLEALDKYRANKTTGTKEIF